MDTIRNLPEYNRLDGYMIKILYALLCIPVSGLAMNQTLINFTQPIKNYIVKTDATEREVGKSHADFSYQASTHPAKHYFFAFLNPQPNGAAFASVHIQQAFNLANSDSLCLTAKGLQDKPTTFQVVLNTSTSNGFSYQHTFTVTPKEATHTFKLKDFSATRRGKEVAHAPPLNSHDIQSVGIRIIGREKTPDNMFQKGLYGIALYQLSVC
ncbi:MAG: CIA30 family protein [Legionellaceae bacterium]|nr:CIA30 family protein [Legionellaceae bacterium]